MLVYSEYLDVMYADPVVQTEEKIVEVQQMQTIERTVEFLEIQCQEVMWHVTVSQDQEVVRQVTTLPRWCLRLTSDPTEYESVVSDTGYSWNPSTMLSRRIAFHRSARRTSTSPLPRIDELVLESSHSFNRRQTQDACRYGPGETVVSETS